MPVTSLQSKLGAYSAMAACFLLISEEADAQVTYVDLVPDRMLTSLGPLDTLHLDIDGDNTTDFIFNASYSYTTTGTGGNNFFHIWLDGL
jgi:hypothetical protein